MYIESPVERIMRLENMMHKLVADNRDKFALALQLAEKNGNDTFFFENREIVVAYGKYLLRYLNERLK
jgi:hypothetical protein